MNPSLWGLCIDTTVRYTQKTHLFYLKSIWRENFSEYMDNENKTSIPWIEFNENIIH